VTVTVPSARRIDRGRGHSYEIDGQPVPGITTILNRGIPKPALIDWAGRETAGYAVDHWDELAELSISQRLQKLEKARFEARDTAAVRGTQIHAFADQLHAGAEIDVPEHLVGHVDAYLKFADDWHADELLVEQPVYHRTLRYAGTPDLVARLADGKLWLLDWKTGGKGIFPEHAIQLAAARYAEFTIDPVSGAELLMPKVDRCGCVWLRADGYDLVPVAADAEAFEVFLWAKRMAGFMDESRERWVADAVQPRGRNTR
jgi:hypothetical protein